MRVLMLSFCVAVVTVACDPHDGGPSSNVNITLKSAAFGEAGALTQAIVASSACHLELGGEDGGVDGLCATPLAVSGTVTRVDLSTTGGAGGPGVRLLGGGNTLHGVETETYVQPFDLGNAQPFPGDDTLQEGQGGYDRITIAFAHVDTKLEAAGSFWTLRSVFRDLPVTTGQAILDCDLDEPILDILESTGNLVDGPAGIRAGDILACKKDSADAACDDEEFQWVDSDTDTVAATRPESPASFTGPFALHPDRCVPGGERPEIELGTADLNVSLASTVDVTAAFVEGGGKEYTVGEDTGNALDVAIDFDLDASVFFPSDVDPATTDEATFLANISDVMLKPLFLKNHRTAEGDGYEPEMSATATVTVKTVEPDAQP